MAVVMYVRYEDMTRLQRNISPFFFAAVEKPEFDQATRTSEDQLPPPRKEQKQAALPAHSSLMLLHSLLLSSLAQGQPVMATCTRGKKYSEC
jgi:hypothetical protein